MFRYLPEWFSNIYRDLGSSYVKPIYKTADSVDGSSLARKKKREGGPMSSKPQAPSLDNGSWIK